MVTDVRVEQEGRVITDPAVTSLIETKPGQPLAMRDIRETFTHLTSLARYDDIRVYREDLSNGIRIRYVLFPAHPVDRVEFRGTTGLSEDDLKRVIRDRFGAAPPAQRQDAVVMLLRDTYRDRGYPSAMIEAHIEPTHNPDRATMVLQVTAGPRVNISNVRIDQSDQTPANVVVGAPDVRVGQPYDAVRVDQALDEYSKTMREKGYLEARSSHTVAFTPAGADVTLIVSRGPQVAIAFTGDPIPAADRDRLVPIRTEASVSQDLLEDAQNAIKEYFHARGYRDAAVELTPVEKPGQLTLTFNVRKGPKYVVNTVAVTGATAFNELEVTNALRVKKGDPLVQTDVDSGVSAIRSLYRNAGYTKTDIMPVVTVLPNQQSEDVERRVDLTLPIVEGPRTSVRMVTITGNTTVPEGDLQKLLRTQPGNTYVEVGVVADRDNLATEYRNRGYRTVSVQPSVKLSDDATQADVTYAISEGPRIIVDHIIITGNDRTSQRTIERELTLHPGDPMGDDAIIESQQRLSALGLFRQVRITELPDEADARHDLLVRVEESPPNTIAVGGGLELSSRLRSSEEGTAEERYEFVPRASFEVGRRNLWGKNRSIDLFTRVALRSRDLVLTSGGLSLQEQQSSLGFNEYRAFATYREPRILGTRADLLLTAILDQAVRSSFNFNRKEARAEIGTQASEKYSFSGRYSYETTRLFDEHFTEDEEPLIDRLFPQVRLSKWSGTLIRNSRRDISDPVGGTFVTATTDVAMRAIGSEVGFVKTFVEGYAYPQLPFGPRTILALGARLGVAHGFPRLKDGEIVQDLPVSERFFAGGDTSVRGFSLDRLGNRDTITTSGFPTGGNAMAVFNTELRFKVTGSVQGVTFVDVGNVYARASDFDLTDMRPAAGFGVRVKAPLITAPLRVDMGFNLDRRELVPGRLEKGYVVHVSLGQAF
ncbi:MAG TPA: POTRA domain-containing protein [Vicinamibacterales bacterium]|nr:POTRA domain-containing protein [Vicinamibacterales bacterium]